MHEITLIIHTGPHAADRREQVIALDTLIGDLITYCRKDYRLQEQDARGELIEYGLFLERGGQRVRLDPQRSLRSLRLPNYPVLYLSDVTRVWWPMGSTAPLTPPEPPPTNTKPIGSQPPISVPEPRPTVSVELAAGCSHPVPENGLIITRKFLLSTLPRVIVAREQARQLIGLESALQAVSRRAEGHCAILWARGWYLHAYRPIYLQEGATKLDHGETLPLDQTTRVVLGRNGWPITIRLSSTLFPRY